MEEHVTTDDRKHRSWTSEEIVKIVKAYFVVSEDPVKGAGQKGDVFNKEVFVVFERTMGGPGTSGRTWSSLRGKRYQVMKSMGKFIGCYNRLKEQNNGQGPSGWCEADYLREAKARYADEMAAAGAPKTSFELEDVFREAREHNKFRLFTAATEPRARPKGTQRAKREKFAEERASAGGAGAEKRQKVANDIVKPEGLSAKAILAQRNAIKKEELKLRKLQVTILMFSDKGTPTQEREEVMQRLRAETLEELRASVAAKKAPRACGGDDYAAETDGVREPLVDVTNFAGVSKSASEPV